MAKFSKDERVWYVPNHADGPSHKDAEAGVVKMVSEPPVKGKTAYKVDYNDGSDVAKFTYERHLQKREE